MCVCVCVCVYTYCRVISKLPNMLLMPLVLYVVTVVFAALRYRKYNII